MGRAKEESVNSFGQLIFEYLNHICVIYNLHRYLRHPRPESISLTKHVSATVAKDITIGMKYIAIILLSDCHIISSMWTQTILNHRCPKRRFPTLDDDCLTWCHLETFPMRFQTVAVFQFFCVNPVQHLLQ